MTLRMRFCFEKRKLIQVFLFSANTATAAASTASAAAATAASAAATAAISASYSAIDKSWSTSGATATGSNWATTISANK